MNDTVGLARDWRVERAFVQSVSLNGNDALRNYHPKGQNNDDDGAAHKMHTVVIPSDGPIYALKVVVGQDGGAPWHEDTMKILDSAVFVPDPNDPNRLVSEELDLCQILGGDLAGYNKVSLSITRKVSGNHRVFTTEVEWFPGDCSENKGLTELGAAQTSYTWPQDN